MKKISHILLLLLTAFTLLSCEEENPNIDPKKEMEEEEVATPIPGAILQGSFTGASGYTTTGTASVALNDDNEPVLSFTDFKTSNGPDLRVYLAEDTKATNFVEITDKVENGNKTYDIPGTVDLEKQKFVLIWCKAFSVSFGSSELVQLEEE